MFHCVEYGLIDVHEMYNSLALYSFIHSSITSQSYGMERTLSIVHCSSQWLSILCFISADSFSPLLRYVFAFVMLHFAKRELETLLYVLSITFNVYAKAFD